MTYKYEMNWLWKAAASDTTYKNRALTCLYRTMFQGEPVLVGTDQYRIHMHWNGEPHNGSCFIQGKLPYDMNAAAKRLEYWPSDLERFFGEPLIGRLTATVGELRQALNPTKAFVNKPNYPVYLFRRSDSAELSVYAWSEHGDVETAIPVTSFAKCAFVAAFNAFYLLDAIHVFQDTATVDLMPTKNTLIVGQPEKNMALIMSVDKHWIHVPAWVKRPERFLQIVGER
ncbi:hypothetical protein Rctr85_086 [Virus Rctr85]|nr:hypothetical protein Rctr85_086 [Virus Rctr85]